MKYVFNELRVNSAKKLLETCKDAKIKFNGRDFEYFTNGKFDSHIKINEYEYNMFEDELYIFAISKNSNDEKYLEILPSLNFDIKRMLSSYIKEHNLLDNNENLWIHYTSFGYNESYEVKNKKLCSK